MVELRLSLLGTPRLQLAGRSIVPTPPAAAMLGYLAIYGADGRAVGRSALAGALWPNVAEDRARRALSETLYRLCQSVGERGWLRADAAAVGLRGVWVDVAEFRQLSASEHLSDWRAAAELFEGDLLAELAGDWMLGPRVALRERYHTILARICQQLAATGDHRAALEYGLRLVSADPYNEDAHRTVMRLQARLGRHTAALQHYDRLVQLLDDDLQAAPLPETRQLASAIRAEVDLRPDERGPSAVLIGRRRERAALLARLELAERGYGGVVLIEGEAGIGKTRLLESLADGAAWRGITMLSAACEPGAGTLLAGLAQAAQASPLFGAVRDALGPETLATLTGRAPPELLAALGAALRALARLRPLVVALDDMHRAKETCWEELANLALRLEGSPALLALSYRADELRDQRPAWRALRALDGGLAPLRLSLLGLTAQESAALALAHGARPEDVAELHRRSGGNPLLLIELARGGMWGDAPVALRDLIDARIAALDESARAALLAAARLGSSFSYRTWQRAAGDIAALRDLIAARLLRETAHGLQFQHGLVREQVLGEALAEREVNAALPPPADEAATYATVTLARADAPLGRQLESHERTELRWTVDAGEPDAALLRTAGKVALRRARIARLLAEARAQGAAPTDADLARALGVTERTIVADMAALRAAGVDVATRRRSHAEGL